jgi:hypothetical protein
MEKGLKLQRKEEIDDQSAKNKYHKTIVYGACFWSLIYAAIFIAWPLRGSNLYVNEFGLDSLYQWGGVSLIVSLCIMSAVVSLAAIKPWGKSISRWIWILFAWSWCCLLIGTAANGIAFDILRVVQLIPYPVDWIGFLNRSLTLVGGILYGKVAISYQRLSAGSCAYCGRSHQGDKEKTRIRVMNTLSVLAGYSAFVLTGGYAVLKVYWSLGGTSGLGILPDGFTLAQSGSNAVEVFVAGWGTVILALFAMVIALATVHSWGNVIPRWVLLSASWIGFGLLAATLINIPQFLKEFQPGDLLIPNPIWAFFWGITALTYQFKTRDRCKHCKRRDELGK